MRTDFLRKTIRWAVKHYAEFICLNMGPTRPDATHLRRPHRLSSLRVSPQLVYMLTLRKVGWQQKEYCVAHLALLQLRLFRLVRRSGRGSEQGIAPGLCGLVLRLLLVFQSFLAIAEVIFQIKLHLQAFGIILHVDHVAHPGIMRKLDKVVRGRRSERLSSVRVDLKHKLNLDKQSARNVFFFFCVSRSVTYC